MSGVVSEGLGESLVIPDFPDGRGGGGDLLSQAGRRLTEVEERRHPVCISGLIGPSALQWILPGLVRHL